MTMKARLTPLLHIFLALLFLSSDGMAAGKNLAFLKQITRSRYPHAHAVLARETESISFEKDGCYVDRDEVFLTIMDDQGKKFQKVQSFYIDKRYSRFNLELFEIIRPDGSRTPVDLSMNSGEYTPASNTNMNIYDPDQKILKVFIPELKPGDTIHYRYTRKQFKPVIPGGIYGFIPVQYTFPVRCYSFTLKGPKGIQIHHLVKDQVKGTVSRKETENGNSRIITWNFTNVPQLFPEPNMPPVSQVAMRLLFSNLDSWKDVSRWYYGLVKPKLHPTRGIIDKVKDLTRNLVSPKDRIAAIFFFVARKIRYMGVTDESNRPGFEPHEVGLTFSRRYGVCRDKAALLVSMLRVAGFNAAPVLVSVGRKLDREIPMCYFNHAIAAILDKDGRPTLFLDPTSETSRQFLPDYERDCSCLVADAAGATIALTPAEPPDKNLFCMEIRDTLRDDGTLEGSIKATSTGFPDTAMRAILMRKAVDEQRAFLEELLLKRRPGLEIHNLKWSDPADRHVPFSFTCAFRLRNAARHMGDKGSTVMLLPLSDMEDSGVLDRWILGKANMTSRKYPVRFGYTFTTRTVEYIRFEKRPGRMDLPSPLNLSNDVLTWRTSFSVRGARLVIRRDFILKKLEVPVSQYQWITLTQHARKNTAILPVLFSQEIKRKPLLFPPVIRDAKGTGIKGMAK